MGEDMNNKTKQNKTLLNTKITEFLTNRKLAFSSDHANRCYYGFDEGFDDGYGDGCGCGSGGNDGYGYPDGSGDGYGAIETSGYSFGKGSGEGCCEHSPPIIKWVKI